DPSFSARKRPRARKTVVSVATATYRGQGESDALFVVVGSIFFWLKPEDSAGSRPAIRLVRDSRRSPSCQATQLFGFAEKRESQLRLRVDFEQVPLGFGQPE